MGLSMYLNQSQEQARQTALTLQRQINGYLSLQKALSEFAYTSDGLSGHAYDSAKAYVSTILIPLTRACILLNEAIAQATADFPNRYVAEVDSTSLHEDQLVDLIAKTDQAIIRYRKLWNLEYASDQPSYSLLNSLDRQIDIQQELKRKLQDKLDKLRAFHWSSPQIFSAINGLAQAVNQGMRQAKTSWNSGTQTFEIPHQSEMDWVIFVSDRWKESMLSKKAEQINKYDIVEDYILSYGLDRATSETLYKLQQGILSEARKKGWNNKQIIYEYNRLIASTVYSATRWYSISGTLPPKEFRKVVRFYGLSLEEADMLMKKLEEQHRTAVSKDLAHEAVQLSSFTEYSWDWRGLSIAIGVMVANRNPTINIEKSTYSEQLYEDSVAKVKQFLIHLASTFANAKRVTIDGTTASVYVPMEQYEISFKGDIDSGRYDDVDFNSDLDAINTYQLLKEADEADLFKIQANYNYQISKNKLNRVESFYDTLGNGDVSNGKAILDFILTSNTLGSDYIVDGNHRTPSDELKALNDFYDYLKRGEKANVKG